VPSPRRQEFDEDGLSSRYFIEVIGIKLNSVADSHKAEKKRDDRFHVVLLRFNILD